MGIRSGQPSISPTFADGEDDTSVIGSKDTINTLSRAWNANLVDENLVIKRGGIFAVASAWSTRRVRQGFEYQKADGTKEILLYGEDATTNGTTGILGKLLTAASPSTISSGLRDAVKPSFTQFRTLAFIFTGYGNLIYNGTTTRAPGIPKPNVAPTFISFTAGDLNTNGAYLFAYTYWNSTTGAESSPSDPSAQVITGLDAAQAGVIINVQGGNATIADKIKIYRTSSAGPTFYLDQIIDNGDVAVSVTCSVSDTGLGEEMELDNSQLTSPAKYGVSLDSRIFAAGFENNPNRVQFSKIGQGGAMPESFQVADFVDCDLNDGDRIVGLGVVNSTVIVLKERSVGRLVKISTDGVGLERTGSQKYIYDKISSEVTGVSHHCMATIDNVLVWLGRNDIYATDGTQIFRLGKRKRKTIKRLNYSVSWKFWCVNDVANQQLIFGVCRPGISEVDYQLVLHYRNFPTVAFTTWTPGPNSNTHPGVTAACAFPVTVNKDTVLYAGTSTNNGLVYQLNKGNSDNGMPIYFSIGSRWEKNANPTQPIVFHSYYIKAVGTGSAPNNTLTCKFEADATENNVIKSATFTLANSNVNWNTANWSEFNWSGLKLSTIKFFPIIRADFGRCLYENTYANQPIAVKAVDNVIQPQAVAA